jgi:predicted protein tyrosine phosphatase
MQIIIHNRNSVRHVDIKEPHAFISITEPEETLTQLTPNRWCEGVLGLRFSDVDDLVLSTLGDKGLVPFSESHAKAIINFYQSLPSINYLIVNCDAGICRSSAIAAAIHIIRDELDLDRAIFDNPLYNPNRRVYRMIIDEWLRTRWPNPREAIYGLRDSLGLDELLVDSYCDINRLEVAKDDWESRVIQIKSTIEFTNPEPHH